MGFTCHGTDIKQLDSLLERHNIAYVKPNASFNLDNHYKNNLDTAKSWIGKHYPLIVARQENIQNGIKLAVSSFENGHKVKASMLFESCDIVKIQTPPNLEEISLYYGWDTKDYYTNETKPAPNHDPPLTTQKHPHKLNSCAPYLDITPPQNSRVNLASANTVHSHH